MRCENTVQGLNGKWNARCASCSFRSLDYAAEMRPTVRMASFPLTRNKIKFRLGFMLQGLAVAKTACAGEVATMTGPSSRRPFGSGVVKCSPSEQDSSLAGTVSRVGCNLARM
jgi:hypothetical protein